MASMTWHLATIERDGEHDVERTEGMSPRTSIQYLVGLKQYWHWYCDTSGGTVKYG